MARRARGSGRGDELNPGLPGRGGLEGGELAFDGFGVGGVGGFFQVEPDLGDGFGDFVLFGEGEAEDVVGFGEVFGAGGLDGVAGGGFAGGVVAEHEAGGGEVEPGFGVVGGVEGDDFGGVALEGGPVLGAEGEDGELDAGRGVTGVEVDGFLEGGDGVLVLMQFLVGEAGEVDGFDVLAVESDGLFKVLEGVGELPVFQVLGGLVLELDGFGRGGEGGVGCGGGGVGKGRNL